MVRASNPATGRRGPGFDTGGRSGIRGAVWLRETRFRLSMEVGSGLTWHPGRVSVRPEMLGLPADRSWIEAPCGGPYLPGAVLELRVGLEHGVAAPRRTLVMELRGP